MKAWSIILSLVVLVSVMMPDTCKEYGETKTENTTGKSIPCDDGCHGCCSPFHACGTCHGFTIAKANLSVASIVQAEQKESIPYIQQFVSSFVGNIWQPPKIG